MIRTPDDLARAAAAAGAVLVSTELVRLRDGSTTIAGRFQFDDPWAAARLLCILAEEDADDPAVASWANALLDQAAGELGTSADDPRALDLAIESVHANVQHWIRFEPEEGERFQSARTTMIEGVGDCDCHARLVHALVRAMGGESELRFLEAGGEPVHAVCAPSTSDGPQWAETTIGAAFGEHPQAAYARLGLDQVGERPDIGFLGLDFVTPGNVAARKTELDAVVQATSADVGRCTTLDPGTRSAWGAFAGAWGTFMADPPGWLDAGAQGRQAAEYADELRQWQERLASACPLSAPTVPEVTDQGTSALKTIAIAAGVVAGAVAVVKVVEVLAPPRGRRRAVA